MTDQINQAYWNELLTGEVLLLGLLGKILYTMPSEEMIQSLVNEDVFSDVPLGEDNPNVQEGLKLLQKWCRAYREGDQQKYLEDLIADYTRLFIGPGFVLAAPWESVYFSEERMVFQERTLKVRNWYSRFGVAAENLHREPDDHIGLELAFLSHLASLGIEAINGNNQAQFETMVDAQIQFLNQHPLKWVSSWKQQVEEHAKTDFFRGIASLAVGALFVTASELKQKA